MDFTLDNWLIRCKEGLYASLFDGIRMTMYVCNILCALYNIHATHGKSIFFSAYMVFLCSLRFGSLRIWGSWEHMWDLSNKLSFLGFLGFLVDLLVQDSIWIYLFSLWPYGPIHSLWWNLYSEGDTILHFAVSHCDSTILLNQAPRPKGSAGAVC